MNDFIYDIPVRVYFGEGQFGNLSTEICKYGSRVLLVYGGGSIKKSRLHERIVREMGKAGLRLYELPGIEPNPKIDSVREGVRICKEKEIDVVLAAGGGSVIDAAKIIAAGACTDHDTWEFFSRRAPIERALPLITVLTMAATGSEMDCGAVISNPETKDKTGRSSACLFPKASFLNPTDTYTVNSYQTACGAVDIMSHVMEVYFNMNADLYMLDCVMEGIMKTVIKYAPVAVKEPYNYEARANLMWASSWAINGFINGGKRQAWSCHPIEHELSAYYDITHGLGLAIVTPRWLKYCLDDSTVSKYYQFGVNVFGIDESSDKMEVAKKSIELLENFFFNTLGLKSSLSEIGIDNSYFGIMAEKACGNGVICGFKPLVQKDIEEILKMCL